MSTNGQAIKRVDAHGHATAGEVRIEGSTAYASDRAETWRDWMPTDAPEPLTLLTRRELAERLQARGHDVTEEKIGYWEKQGVLPRPVRQWHDGATRATYPDWMVDVIRVILVLRQDGESTRNIRRAIRNLVSELASQPAPDDAEKGKARSITNVAREYAEIHNKNNANKIATIHIAFQNEHGGNVLELQFPLHDK